MAGGRLAVSFRQVEPRQSLLERAGSLLKNLSRLRYCDECGSKHGTNEDQCDTCAEFEIDTRAGM